MIMKGCIFDIQRFSVHDGPGIRTTIFLKGCTLKCKWCCNPESICAKPELMFNPELCISCGACAKACAQGAVSFGRVERALCTGCGACAQVCYAEALYMKGRYMTPAEIAKEALKDVSFYARTSGGVTFSGGEPLLQIDFLAKTLALCKASGLHTAIETCGNILWENFERIVSDTDVFLYDIKSTHSETHLVYTGATCERIMENCAKLARIAKRVIIRVPVIPMFNFTIGALTQIVRFAESVGVGEVNFLPYHRYAVNKYSFLGRECWNPGVNYLDENALGECVEAIQADITLRIHG